MAAYTIYQSVNSFKVLTKDTQSSSIWARYVVPFVRSKPRRRAAFVIVIPCTIHCYIRLHCSKSLKYVAYNTANYKSDDEFGKSVLSIYLVLINIVFVDVIVESLQTIVTILPLPPWWALKYCFHGCLDTLTHWGRDKMAAIFQTTFLNAFSSMKSFVIRFKFHWSFFLRFQLTTTQHWYR